MEERIISYENNNEVNQIISEMSNEEFFLTEHKTNSKQLHFKKFKNHPSKKITEDE
jgi:hypothetical protein